MTLRMILLASMLAAQLLLPSMSVAQERVVILAVSEGTSGVIDAADVALKYAPVAELIGGVMKRNVTVLAARDFKRLEQSLARQEYDFLLARPSDYPARAVRDYGYRYVATATPEGHCAFIASPGSALSRIEDVKGRSIGLPEKEAYMSRFCTAELRDRGINVASEKTHYLRDQEALVFSARNGLIDVVGVASYSRAFREWEAGGNPVLHRSAPQPFMPLVAASRISPAHVQQIQLALRQASASATAKDAFRKLGIDTFTVDTQPQLDALLIWLSK